GGSGGTIFVDADTIDGNGSISAIGGNGRSDGFGGIPGGGGGRIALISDSDTFSGSVIAHGGQQTPNNGARIGYHGGAGTIYREVAGEGTLYSDNLDRVPEDETTPVPSSSIFDHITVSNKATISFAESGTINGTLTI